MSQVIRTERTIKYYFDEVVPDGTLNTDEWGKRVHDHPDKDKIVEELFQVGTVIIKNSNCVFDLDKVPS
jgi:hypothetical protein